MSLEVESLVKVYGEQRAVDNISFSAKKGEILGFLGPNGAGKSTTMKIATCFIPPTSGTIKVCGFDVTLNPIEARKKIGYLPENNPLYTDMYVKEYLEFTGAAYGLKGKLLEYRVNEMIEITGLTPEKKKKVGMLSKGYRQRVGLAAAMIHDPEVLILDEPTTGLDPNQVLEIRNLIRQAGKEKTVIFSSHIMQEVQEICDRVVIINSGKIVADNDVNKLTVSALKGYKIIVQFSEEIKPDLLSAVNGVGKVNKLDGNRYEISSDTKDIRQDVFKVINEQGWNLLEMKTEEMTLEKVFQQLTK
jgi:ABC-2 type transport system ATP-binding protein